MEEMTPEFLAYWESVGARVYVETHEERAWKAWQAALEWQKYKRAYDDLCGCV